MAAMELNEAKRVIEALAAGVDPRTGEIVGPDSVLESSQVVRALHVAMRVIEAQIRREASKTALPGNAGNPWTPEEEREVLRRYKIGESAGEIARRHGRTKGAIIARLEKLGLEPASDVRDARDGRAE
jgi:DNA-binding NarL/FixJ family response regulator